jgi:hypothetical protein
MWPNPSFQRTASGGRRIQTLNIMRKMLYVLAAMPFCISFGGWKLSVLLAGQLGCSVASKDPYPCMLGKVDIGPILDAFAWWGMLLWWPCLLISGLALGSLVAPSIRSPWGSRPRHGQ